MDIDFSLYDEREHAYVKHWVLTKYLQRLVLIVGQHVKEINYVDCFSGPWNNNDQEKLSDTSIGIALAQLEACKDALAHRRVGKPEIRINAFFIEKKKSSFKRLESYLAEYRGAINATAINDEFENVIDDVKKKTSSGFTFYFVDPLGYTSIAPETLEPLLNHRDSELLINLMSSFIARFIESNDQKQIAMLSRIIGEESLDAFDKDWVFSRSDYVAHHYRRKLKQRSKLHTWASSMPIQNETNDGTKYHLVYVTHSPKGMEVFRERVDKGIDVQKDVHATAMARRQIERKEAATGTSDLFGDDWESPTPQRQHDYRKERTQSLLYKELKERLTKDWQPWGMETLATLLEDFDCSPDDVQESIKRLIDEGIMEIDRKSSRRPRTKNFLLFRDSERVRSARKN